MSAAEERLIWDQPWPARTVEPEGVRAAAEPDDDGRATADVVDAMLRARGRGG